MDKQHLRDLRHKDGCKVHSGGLATCPICDKTYTSEEIIYSYLKAKFATNSRVNDVLELIQNTFENTSKYDFNLLLEILSECSQSNSKVLLNRNDIELISNTIHNLHSSMHVKQCFKQDDECRYYFPRPSATRTTLELVNEITNWFTWNGTKQTYKQYEIESQRNDFDVMVNPHCRAISASNIATNSNCRYLSDARAVCYTTNYSTKANQDEEESEYKKVLQFTQKRMYEQRYTTEFSESLSRLLGASFAHSSNNVISAWMAKYLIRNGSRFVSSHKPVYIPVLDLENELKGERSKYGGMIREHGEHTFVDSNAQHYIFRPNELEKLTCVDFYLQYNVVRTSKSNSDDMVRYHHVEYPGTGYMGAKKSKEKNRIPKIILKFIPSSENFGGDILMANLKGNAKRNEEMEKYAMRVLILYSTYRNMDDLMIAGSYVKKFIEWSKTDGFTDKIRNTLGNLQDMKNMKNLARQPDTLAKDTTAYKPTESTKKTREDDEDDNIPEAFLESLLSDFVAPHSSEQTCHIPGTSVVNMTCLLDRGHNLCGFRNIALPISPESISANTSESIIESTFENTFQNTMINTSDNTTENIPSFIFRQSSTVGVAHKPIVEWEGNTTVQMEEIIKLIGSRVDRVIDEDRTLREHNISIVANGTVESIVKWARHHLNFDAEQRRAFEIITAKFVLTYYEEAQSNPERSNRTRGQFRQEKLLLEAMVGKSHQLQLLMFLTGPGGSGKSEIVKGVLQYGKEYCTNLEVPFTERTILITACSGVAATLINGETIHRAVYLNKDLNNLTAAHVEKFEEVRLLIIDEISFLAADNIRKLDSVLRKIREQLFQKYGGLDIIFMGDFSQIPPIGGTKIYEEYNLTQWHDWMNCFIQLKGRWRFKDDPVFGDVCWRFHEGTPTPDDFDFINSRLLSSK